MSREAYQGGCLCGNVRYQINAKPEDMSGVTACHCQQCRRWSGHYWASIHVPKTTLRITSGTDNISWFTSSDKAKRGFCQICGSTLFWHGFGYDALKNKIDISAGSLDESKNLQLVRHIFCRSKGAYYKIKDGVPKHQSFPVTPAADDNKT